MNAHVSSVSVSDYPLNPQPRWGYLTTPPNPTITRKLNERRAVYHDNLARFNSFKALLHSIPKEAPQGDVTSPFWGQGWFSTLDAASLVCFLGVHKPKRYIEIGSGNSTKFARFTIKSLDLATTVTSIDPNPWTEIDALCDTVIRAPLQQCDLTLFDSLDAGDILFFDGSHRVFTNSDVQVFFFEVLPRLKNGVVVHVHDVFLPEDYPLDWSHRFYSDQYILAALLLAKSPSIKTLMPNFFVCRDDALRAQVMKLFSAAPEKGGPDIELFYNNDGATPGVSFWFETAFQE